MKVNEEEDGQDFFSSFVVEDKGMGRERCLELSNVPFYVFQLGLAAFWIPFPWEAALYTRKTRNFFFFESINRVTKEVAKAPAHVALILRYTWVPASDLISINFERII